MLRIGEFSSLAQVSVKTLRYYDETGLLTPASVDAATGYRYYTAAQLCRLHQILALKEFGFSLEQIAELLRSGVTAEQMRAMLHVRLAEQQKRATEEIDRLNSLSNHLRLIEQERLMTYSVVTKNIGSQWIASVRETIPAYNKVGVLYGKVAEAVGGGMRNSVMPVAIWHDAEYKESDVDAEAGFYLREPVTAQTPVSVHELPSVFAAVTVHNGAYQRLPEAYDALLRWVADNSYHVAGPIRELYLQTGEAGRQDDESCVTEIQVPVTKES